MKSRFRKLISTSSLLLASAVLGTGCQSHSVEFQDLDASKIVELAHKDRATNDLIDSYIRRVGRTQAVEEIYPVALNGDAVDRVLYCYISEQAFVWTDICNMQEMNDNPAAVHNVGLAYLLGKPSIPQDFKAFESTLRHLDDIAPIRADWLRYLAFDRELEPYNDSKVMIEHLISATEKGHAGAQREMGRRLLFGLYLKQNLYLAKPYLQAAYEKNDLKAGMLLVFLFDEDQGAIFDIKEREEIVSRLTEFQYPEFDYYRAFNLLTANEGIISKEALLLMERSAENGYPSAQYYLAQRLLKSGKPADIKKGESYLLGLSGDGNHDGMFKLAEEYCSGETLTRDTDHCITLWTKAALDGHEISSFKLENSFVMRGSLESFHPYVNALKQAVTEENPVAMYSLYNLYIKGNGVERNTGIANYYLKTAAEMGYPPAVKDAEGYDFSYEENKIEARIAEKVWTERYVQQGYKDSILRLLRKAEAGEIWTIDDAGKYYFIQLLADKNGEFERIAHDLRQRLDSEALQKARVLEQNCTIESVFECGAVTSL